MRRLIFTILILGLAAPPSLVAAQNGFDPNVLISDSRFIDTATLGGAVGIQKFLEAHSSVLANTSADFLVKLREPGDVNLKSRLPDPQPNLGRLRTAAELIYDAAIAAGINPQVVLVTLHKEQSLIEGKFTTNAGLQRALDHALGFGCPDEGGCSDLFLGFYFQLFGNFDAADNRYVGMPASLARSFYWEVGGTRVGRGPAVDAGNNAFGSVARVRVSRVGDVITMENTQGPPNNAAPTQQVTLTNFATAALYRYTPHIYNGNFNFARFFVAWFKYRDGTLLQVAGDPKIYVVDSGLKRQISQFVIAQRGLNLPGLVPVSAGELSEYPAGEVMPPKEGTLIRNPVGGQIYIIEGDSRKYLSSFVAQQRKLNLAAAVNIADEEISSYKDGGRALPAEGTLVKSRDNPGVFMITNNEKRLLSAFVFKQRGLKFADVLTAEPGELDSYPTGTVLPPADGTLVKAANSPAVFHVGNGKLEPLTAFVFKVRSFSFKNVQSVAPAELASWEVTRVMPPPTGLLIKARSNPAVYYTEGGVKRPISFDVFVVRKFNFKDVIVGADPEIELIELGEPLKLPERALVKTKDNAAVYFMVDGILQPLTFNAFQNRSFRFSDVFTISAEEFAKYQVGDVVEN